MDSYFGHTLYLAEKIVLYIVLFTVFKYLFNGDSKMNPSPLKYKIEGLHI